MAHLTERRFAKAKIILDRYRKQLHENGSIPTSLFEKELRECWNNMHYQALKGVMIDLAKQNRYRYLAAYYMDHSNGAGVVVEFQRTLADLYGLDYYHSPERASKREAFWNKIKPKK